MMYSLLMNMLEERGVTNEFAEQLFPDLAPSSLRRPRLTERRSRTKVSLVVFLCVYE